MAYLGSTPANAVVTSQQIADGVITTSDLADNAVTTAKVNNNAVTVAKLSAEAQSLNWRNRIINGDMRIDQRNNGASVTPTNGQFIVDRFKAYLTQGSKYTAQQNAGGVTPPSGFRNYLGATSSSAYSVVSSDYFGLAQAIEGFNIADLGWGTASAQTITLSFWVLSSLTGTFGGALASDSSANRSYPFTYAISAANTWEYKTITISGDTTGAWLSTNGLGVEVRFGLGAGSTWSGTAGAWVTGNLVSATGATSVVGTNGATFYITGVQLEAGSVATPFERVEYGEMLRRCQRYFCSQNPTSTLALALSATAARVGLQPFVTMRATPTFTRTGSLVRLVASGVDTTQSATSFTDANSSPTLAVVQLGNFSGLSTNATYVVADGFATIGLNAEL